jgi:hypothetical protein
MAVGSVGMEPGEDVGGERLGEVGGVHLGLGGRHTGVAPSASAPVRYWHRRCGGQEAQLDPRHTAGDRGVAADGTSIRGLTYRTS